MLHTGHPVTGHNDYRYNCTIVQLVNCTINLINAPRIVESSNRALMQLMQLMQLIYRLVVSSHLLIIEFAHISAIYLPVKSIANYSSSNLYDLFCDPVVSHESCGQCEVVSRKVVNPRIFEKPLREP